MTAALAAEPRMITAPGVYYDIPAAEYHRDCFAGGSLSSTGARRLLDSPARFHWERINPARPTITMQVGTAVHTKVLGVGDLVVTYPDEHLTPSGSVSTKAATTEWVAEQTAAGLIVLNRTDFALVAAMSEAVLGHRGARRLLEAPGTSEASVFATDPDTGVRVRARFDRLGKLDGESFGVDLKTTAGSASVAGFGREAAKYGYPVQEAHYLDTLKWATGERPPMSFVVVEKAPPHLVAVHRFDETTRHAAAQLAARARQIYAQCTASGQWPAYGDEPLITEMPAWWWNQIDDDQDQDMVV